ncbi:undecaprenyldiphospho-muramoylpentapeptide beta-N-acetylglucosaminyltransferase [Thiohalobacter sp. IOR34]|uniref:undecaprenyldiphospho-muramoylpentapeptide beta-N-acetylglucosaminyltransferase n=1 Tax=Thiohalobacter sp. IOR34 TaxID=3057176 RepID=UPI0025AF9222|nr:undecaprenyldiphospho-muramoylpentapeptide beta-N-acetylglucosaminyltransferase [Thiohalobacter sp. IOR34]WJW75008.1 undecaprenyldiphospho-muramoylpentapeptide beta-N-acetylglucosaminyltransferase [Thiohalobacter sp. IOR34]
MSRRPILIMAGGTGGHVFPALAVAAELRRAGVAVAWLGTRRGLEARLVPAAGYPMAWIRVSGLRGKGLGRRLVAPFMLALALLQSLWVMLRLRPRAVLGMGGFVTGPGGVMAWLTRRPLLIHEQNSVAGLTNRLLAPLARRVMEGFPDSLPARYQPIHTGNPVRAEIAALPAPEARFAGRHGRLRLLVLGGSLGAQALNEVLPRALAALTPGSRPEVRHQSGERNLEAARAAYAAAGVEAELLPFIDDMAAAYGWADLVLCRAGALTVAELTAAGVGALLVPYPHAVDDHQTGNARYLERAGAGLLLPQAELDADRLAALLDELGADRERLLAMARAARALARPDAARRVAELCLIEAGGGA